MSNNQDPSAGLEYTACKLCNSTENDIWQSDLPDYLLDRPEIRATLVKCRRCGLVYQNPRPSIEQIGEHYPTHYQPFATLDSAKKTSRISQIATDYGLNKRCNAIMRHKRSGTILDVGCATGEFLNAMRKRPGWKTAGVEISPEAAAFARQRYGLEVFEGVLDGAPFPDESFDVITMWDVLEHLHDPTQSLVRARRLLKKDGIILVRLPNLASLDARIFGRCWAGYDAPRHLFVFDPLTLRKVFEQVQLSPVEMHTRLGNYGSFAISVDFWAKEKDLRPATQASIRSFLNHPAVRVGAAPFFWLNGILFIGATITAIARKN